MPAAGAKKQQSPPKEGLFQAKIALGITLMLAAYCGGAGRIALWPGWVYSGFFLVSLTVSNLLLRRVAPDLIRERVSVHAASLRTDPPIVAWLALTPILTPLAAGLDVRYNGLEVNPLLVISGYLVATTGSTLTHRAMSVNRFYAPTVRLQPDRGQTVVQAGPYGIIRHPGNLGNVLLNAAMPLMLGSRWAWVPAAISIVLTVVRTALEDRFLRAGLQGYEEYTLRTRSRLIPGVW